LTWERREWHGEIGRFILPPYLYDLTYTLDNYNWYMSNLWEFDPRGQASYLSDLAYLNAMLGCDLFDNNNVEDKDNEGNNGGQPNVTINPKV
jgi:hypothetical protein